MRRRTSLGDGDDLLDPWSDDATFLDQITTRGVALRAWYQRPAHVVGIRQVEHQNTTRGQQARERCQHGGVGLISEIPECGEQHEYRAPSTIQRWCTHIAAHQPITTRRPAPGTGKQIGAQVEAERRKLRGA